METPASMVAAKIAGCQPPTSIAWRPKECNSCPSTLSADRQLRRILEKSVADYWAVAQPSLTQSVIRILHARVVFPDATLEALANELTMHPRTLNRRLQAEGTNFRNLVSEARFSVSRQLLLGTKMDVTDIALALGYGDPSNFTHAFQKWSGMALSEWRKQ
jgi:AraC-like DNA-binding protein